MSAPSPRSAVPPPRTRSGSGDNSVAARPRRCHPQSMRRHTETHCSQGHPWTKETLYVHPTTGQRNCRECQREYSRTYRRRRNRREWYLNGGKDAMNKRRRTKQYGVTPEQWDRMNEEQGGLCAACRSLPQGQKTLDIDHSHRTGEVRKLLCRNCNIVLGLVGESPETLRALAAYLEEFQQAA